MSNTREVLTDRFIVFSGAGKRQSAQGTAMINGDLDTRDKCTIAREEVITRKEFRDCQDIYLTKTKIDTRFLRWTLTYNEVTPQMIARWTAYKEGAAAGPTGSPADEVQTLARTGTVSGGTFTISVSLEGRTVTTKPIAWNASTATIQAALTAARMMFVNPGDVVVGGDWTGGITLTFQGRLAKANIPSVVIDATLLTGSTPGISVTESTAGVQRYHAISRSTSRQKAFFSFALGWLDDADRVEKYIDAVVDTVAANLSLDGAVTLTVTLLTPWEYDSIETAFSIPACVSIDALQTNECRISVDSDWLTVDTNSLTATINDAIPTDKLSAFSFDGMDLQRTERGRQPVDGPVAASFFGSEVDPIYELAQNERTEDPVPVIIHFGFPGDRCTWNFDNCEVRFQTNRQGEAGDARYSTVQIDAIPVSSSGAVPFDCDAYVSQSTAFLAT